MLHYVVCKALIAFIEAKYSGLNDDISILHSQEKHMVVFVEQTVMDDTLLINNPGFSVVKEKLMTFRDGKDDLTDKIDFIICLGGDGTLLYASLLFQVVNFLLLWSLSLCIQLAADSVHYSLKSDEQKRAAHTRLKESSRF
jgi:hypothetical protein